MKLIIVESPTKAKHIGHLFEGYRVVASFGHIRDLPLHGEESYVRPPDFIMHYTVLDEKKGGRTSKKEIVEKIRTAMKGVDDIYLATDPDREGEAIAWHLAQVLGIRNAKRISYQEVTETAIKKALSAPRGIDLNLVSAQEARRGLDRMIGWEVSSPLSASIGQQASAGRVQSPAIILVCMRENEIRKFVSVDWYSVEAVFPGASGNWTAKWKAPSEYFQDGEFASRLALAIPGLPFKIVDFARTIKKHAPSAPFITTEMQKVGSKTLGFGVDQIMKLAQSLFEQGLITYHRTDSPNLSADGEALVRAECERRKYPLSPSPRRWKLKAGAQEAHEAIRPTETSIRKENSGSTDDERALFNLIWKRTMASQMVDAESDAVRIVLDGGPFEGKQTVFTGSGSKLVSPGWRTVFGVKEDADEEDMENPIPTFEKGKSVRASGGKATAKKTSPPSRYTEATLVDALEKAGIGRPSTYASIITALGLKGYTVTEKKYLCPTRLGEAVSDALVGRFQFADIDYTKNIEKLLDDIAEGKARFREVLSKVWSDLQSNLKNLPAGSGLSAGPVHPCPECGKPLFKAKSERGVFWGCSDYKNQEKPCKVFLRDDKGSPGERIVSSPSEQINVPCPKCGEKLHKRKTKNDKSYVRCPADNTHGPWWFDDVEKSVGKEWDKLPPMVSSSSSKAKSTRRTGSKPSGKSAGRTGKSGYRK